MVLEEREMVLLVETPVVALLALKKTRMRVRDAKALQIKLAF